MKTWTADACVVVGLMLLAVGLWMIWPPCALVVFGLLGVAMGARLHGAI